MTQDKFWRARVLLEDKVAIQETQAQLIAAGFSIVADVLDIAANASRAPAELQDKLHAAFLDLTENAPLDHMGTGTLVTEKSSERAWDKRVRKVKRLIIKVGRIK